MKNLKNVLCLCLIFFITALTGTNVLAKDINTTSTKNIKAKTQKINEYEVIKNLQSKTDEELRESGFSDDKIKELRNLNLKKIFLERLLQDDEHLRKLGYSDERINEIKKAKQRLGLNQKVKKRSQSDKDSRVKKNNNPQIDKDFLIENNISEEELETMMAFSSAQLWISSDLNTIDSAQKNWGIKFWWQWTEQPYFLQKDIIGVGWQASKGSYPATAYFKSGRCTVRYDNGPGLSGTLRNLSVSGKFSTASVTIPMLLNAGGSNAEYNDGWAISGEGQINVNNNTGFDTLEMRFLYGHTVMTITAQPKLNKDGVDFEITPSVGIDDEGESRHIYDKNGII